MARSLASISLPACQPFSSNLTRLLLPHGSLIRQIPQTPLSYDCNTSSRNSPVPKSGKTRTFCVVAASKEVVGSIMNVEGLRFAVVAGRFNEFVTKALVEGALGTFKAHSVKETDIDVVWVPGSFEIPIVAQNLGKSGRYHAVLCIGTVIRGDTTHYDAVANSAASGVLSAGLNSGVPCIFGILTCDNLEQALHRAGGKAGNKGAEAAVTAIEMASLFQHHLPKLT